MHILFSSDAGRRFLLDALEKAKRNEARGFMRRQQLMAQTETGCAHASQGDGPVCPEADQNVADAIRIRCQLEAQVCTMPASIAPEPKHTNWAQIGLVVTYRYVDGCGSEHSVFLAGYDENFSEAKPPFVAYNSPIGKNLIRCEVGDIVTLPKGDAEITGIEYPEMYQERLATQVA